MRVEAPVTADELARRVIRYGDLVADDRAFIDTKTPGSDGKLNYPVLGPGVSQNSDQVVPLNEPHGFNMGAAAMPNGVTNSLHLHFTAEVFCCFRGEWLLRWGPDGKDGEAVLREGDVVSIPTWIFRGFTNIGSDDGWLYTALGNDDTGGIVWDPSVLEEASKYGLHLSADDEIVETAPGAAVPEGIELVTPLSGAEMAELRHVSESQMRERLAEQEDLLWSQQAFLDARLRGGGSELALVIGYGMTEDKEQYPRVHNPHGFSLAWLRAAPGHGMLRHRQQQTQLLVIKDSRWRLTLNDGDRPVAVELGEWDAVSVPAGAWRELENIGDGAGKILVICGGDERVRIDWDPTVVDQARQSGLVSDPNGYLSSSKLLVGRS